jgi:medium-chain acyl-[acyl-carrier-protein] hydrolase
MVEAMRPWLDLPFAIFGQSMGSLLAFEWARLLETEGGPAPAHLIVTGRRAPDCLNDGTALTPLSDDEFIEALARIYGGLPDELLKERELMEVMLPVLRADLAVVESYQFREGTQLMCPITAFAGADDATVSYEQLLAWQRHTRSGFKAGLAPGGHFFPPGPVLQAIGTALSDCATNGTDS